MLISPYLTESNFRAFCCRCDECVLSFPHCLSPIFSSFLIVSLTFLHSGLLHFLLRWLDWIFLGRYLPSLSINYVATSKGMGKRLPQLYLLYKDGFYCNLSRHSNVTTPLRFLFIFVFLCTKSFFKKSLKGVCTCRNCLNYGKV